MSSQGSEDLQGTLEMLNRWVDLRIEDIDFVLDKILNDQEDNSYEAMIDRNQIILSGHSLGGSSVLAVGRERSEDIQALVVLEAPFVKDITGIENGKYQFMKEKYPRPILNIYSDSLWGKLDEITTTSSMPS